MSSPSLPKVSPFRAPSPIRSAIFKTLPDVVPSVDELESLQEELKVLKARTLERAKKAGEDLKTIEDTMRKLKEREKGKAKAKDYTPELESKPRFSSQPLSGDKKHKKKRKRDDESDHEQGARPKTSQRNASSTAYPSSEGSKVGLVHVSSSPQGQMPPRTRAAAKKANDENSQQVSTGGDFSVPPVVSLLPTRPVTTDRPKPLPRRTVDVVEDFSMAKQPAQTPVTTFYSSVEPYLRPIREEDLGFLEFTADEVDPYVMPKLGRHYTEVWAEQDALALGKTLSEPSAGLLRDAPPDTFAAPTPKWDPSTLNDGDLVFEARGHGPLTERVLSALLPVDNGTWKGVKAAEDAMEGRPGGSGAAAAKKERLNVTDLEARVRDTMRFHGLLDGVPDYSDKVDDPISTALRHAQQELRQVSARNQARKERLIVVARDRLGYQEYLEARDALDRNISAAYTKLQKKTEPKPQKKKNKKFGDASASGTPVPEAVPPPPPPCPAALGLGPDEDNQLIVTEQLKHLVDTRRQWVDTVGSVFDQRQADRPGHVWGFPETSVYEGIEAEVNALLLGQGRAQAEPQAMDVDVKGKGKERERTGDGSDAMDVG
ncbi:Chromatin-remodeling complexes subunit ngg1 [Mycena kentingensis (nom. inval.)]|nr:Chromatin-remodeling complexes subunit ngg1 [Mycena kentingensis (nom. inval.)]